MKFKYILADNPYLQGLKETIDLEEEVIIKKLLPESLLILCEKNSHSWAGSKGTTARLITKSGEVVKCQSGGWYSDNGRMTDNSPAIPAVETLITEDCQISPMASEIIALAVRDWDAYNNPSQEYDDWTLFLRPTFKIEDEVEKYLEKKLKESRDLVL